MKPVIDQRPPRRSEASSTRAGAGATVLPMGVRAGLLLAWMCAVGCVLESEAWPVADVAGFSIRFGEGTDTGSLTAPLPFPTEARVVELEVEARDRHGNPLPDWEAEVRLRVVPGRLAPGQDRVRLVDGRWRGTVSVQFAYGDTRFWVQDDLQDTGRVPSWSLGVSDALLFNEPRVRNVRFNPDSPTGLSPLLGNEARISEGVLIVSNVVANGFYLTDVSEALPSGVLMQDIEVEQEPFSSLFVFTFNFAEGINLGDRLCSVAGGVAEFQGQSQLTFPSYVIQGVGRVGEAPDESFLDPTDPGVPGVCRYRPEVDGQRIALRPRTLEPALLDNATAIRAWDSALVRIEGATLSRRFDDCDFDGSGQIEGDEERACRSRCQRDADCTEMSSLRSFDQVSASAGNVVFEVADAGRAAGFDPLGGCEVFEGTPGSTSSPPGFRCPAEGRSLASITGTLRLVDLGGVLLKVIIPRFEDDLVFVP